MENKLKELETLTKLANAISNNIYESTFASFATIEAKEDKEFYLVRGRIDFLYSYIKDTIKNSEDTDDVIVEISTILIKHSTHDGDDAILEFENLIDQRIWNNLSPWLHNGESDNSHINQWIDLVYPNKKPPFYGVYRMSGY